VSPSDGGSGVGFLNILISFLSMLISLVELDAAAHMKRQIALDQMKLQGLAVNRLQIRGDELSRRQREPPITTRPQHHEDRKTEQHEAADSHPYSRVEVVSGERLSTEEGRGDGRGGEQLAETGMRATGECLPASVGPSSQLDHGSLLIVQSSPGLPIGKRIAGPGRLMRARIHDRARYSAPETKRSIVTRLPPRSPVFPGFALRNLARDRSRGVE
jgi:hypothetical protein